MEKNKNNDLMDKVVNLCKRRGFIFPGSEIYGGLANTWDFGPLGTEMKKNIKNEWWRRFIQMRKDMHGLDAAIIMNPKVWEASGHVAAFNDPLVECKACNGRFRADHILEDVLGEKTEGKSLQEIDKLIQASGIACPDCGAFELGNAKQFNLLFKTFIGPTEGAKSTAYLRGETAQGIFVNYKNVLDSIHPKIPFGIGQIGKAFRNEITPGNFIFRTLEFEQMEIEYFVRQEDWENYFNLWQQEMKAWLLDLGIREENFRFREHAKEELSHYSKKTVDIEYKFPFGGFKELWGIAYRTDFDLKNHMEKSGIDMNYFDQAKNEKFIPHVIEPTFGVERTVLTLLLEAYTEEEAPTAKGGKETRAVLKLNKKISPYQIAVLPLSKKAELAKTADKIFKDLSFNFRVEYDETQSIGKRYRRQDEIGTPYCVTIDFDTLTDMKVTVRDRDTMKQERVMIDDLMSVLSQKLA